MALLIVGFGVLLLLFLMVKLKLDGFMSLILVSIIVGFMEGLPLAKIPATIYKGIGGQLNSLLLILAFGAMLGKLLADSGAAQRIATTFINLFGKKNVQWAMILTSIIVGITMFFEAGFIVLFPIICTIAIDTGLPLMYVGLPAVIGLSTTHSFLPPHPGPAAVCTIFGADMGHTLFLGLLIAIPAAVIMGVFYSRSNWVLSVKASIPAGLVTSKVFKEEEMPGFGVSMFSALIPVVLMAASTMADLVLTKKDPLLTYLHFFGDAPIALMLSVMLAMYLLGTKRGKDIGEVVSSMGASIKAIAMILLVIGAGGAFKQVIVDAGVGNSITALTKGLAVSPIILAWGVAAAVRIAVGSATVAITTAAGIVLPIVQASGISPELMVIATSSGSLFASHVNDPGFWMFKEYFNVSVAQAIKVRTTYSCILSIFGLIGVLLLHQFV
jgi:gluconate transporter